jgi:hypothetical protein
LLDNWRDTAEEPDYSDEDKSSDATLLDGFDEKEHA